VAAMQEALQDAGGVQNLLQNEGFVWICGIYQSTKLDD